MHILIATSGALPAAAAVEFTTRLLRDGGRVTVTTVIEVPHTFLEDLRTDGWHPLEDGELAQFTPEEDALIAKYVEERGRRLTGPVVDGLEAAGITAGVHYLEGEHPAKQVSMLADEIQADLVVLGATKQIFDRAVWESVSAQVMIESAKPVLVLPAIVKAPQPATEPSE